MSLVAIKNRELDLFKKIMENGYVVGDGKTTRRVIRELKRAHVPIHHGYARETKKVIVALDLPVKFVIKQQTLAKTIFKPEK